MLKRLSADETSKLRLIARPYSSVGSIGRSIRRSMGRIFRRWEAKSQVPAIVREHFDAAYYYSRYPDVSKSGTDPVVHYFKHGAAEGRDPAPYFSTRRYVMEHGQKIPPGMNPFHYFLTVGNGLASVDTTGAQDWATLERVMPYFDFEFYCTYNKLDRQQFDSLDEALRHYLEEGWRLGYDPGPKFSTRAYLSGNPDVEQRGLNPLVHFVSGGSKRGRSALPSRYRRAVRLDLLAELERAMHRSVSGQPAPELREDVTIIVPVYNAPDDVTDLLDSLNRTVARSQPIVLVDDASPDPSIAPLLSAWAEERAATRIVRLAENRGYSAAINAALSGLSTHAIVLNTDVVLPLGWLGRLMAPIDQYPGCVASVTPFSNTSALTGFPNLGDEGPPYLGAELDVIDGAWSRLPRYQVDLPSACGFCMALNRRALSSVGGFDSGTYGRGYYEETDWCQRALALGFRHAAAVDLFVAHKPGSASFGLAERVALSDRNRAEFDRRNPAYPERERLYRFIDPGADFRTLARLLVWLKLASKKVLLLTHSWGGGIAAYTEDRSNEFVQDGAFVVLMSLEGSLAHLNVRFRDEQITFSVDSSAALRAMRSLELSRAEIHALHGVDALPGFLPQLRDALEGIPYAVYMHDFLALCPTIHLIDDDGRFCHIPEASRCLECLHRNSNIRYPATDITSWRQLWHPILAGSDEIVTFNETGQDYLLRAFPTLEKQHVVLRPPSYDPALRAVRIKPRRGPLHVAVIGRMADHKGAGIVRDLAQYAFAERLKVALTVVGEWYGQKPLNVKVTGPYEPAELPELLERLRAHVVLHPSICPETFSFTLSEVFSMNLPVVALAIGAQGHRVARYSKGVVCDGNATPRDIMEALHRAAML